MNAYNYLSSEYLYFSIALKIRIFYHKDSYFEENKESFYT